MEEKESKYEEFLYIEDFEAADKEILDKFTPPTYVKEDIEDLTLNRPDGCNDMRSKTKKELESALKSARAQLMRDKRDEDRVRSNRF